MDISANKTAQTQSQIASEYDLLGTSTLYSILPVILCKGITFVTCVGLKKVREIA